MPLEGVGIEPRSARKERDAETHANYHERAPKAARPCRAVTLWIISSIGVNTIYCLHAAYFPVNFRYRQDPVGGSG